MDNLKSNRITYISLLQAFAIFCVVIGHVTRIYYYPGGWYYHAPEQYSTLFNVITRIIYTFHMPLFVFLSGYLCERTLLKNPSIKNFIKRRFNRLFIPFWTWGLFFGVPIWLYLQFPDSNYKTFATGQVMGHLWFLPLLLEVTIIYLLLRKIPSKYNLIVFIALFSLQFFHIKCCNYFSIPRIPEFLVFYFMGAMFFKFEKSRFFENNLLNYLITIFSLLGFIFIEYQLYLHNFRGSLRLILAPLFGIINLVTLSKIVSSMWPNFIENNKIIQFLSINMFYIYLIHEPIMEIILKHLGWGNSYHPLTTFSFLLLGTISTTFILINCINYCHNTDK